MGYSDIGVSKTFNEAIEIARAAFKDEVKKNPRLLYEFDKEANASKRFIIITDLYTNEDVVAISLEELAKYYVMKKIIGNMK